MQFPLFAPIITSMPSQRIGFLQYQPPLSKVQPLFSVAAYFQKVVDTHSFVGIITQQLSNSATQQLSNSATQQLRRKVCLRPEKRAAFLFRRQHHYFFSSIFADGKCTVSVFPIKPQRVPHMRIQIEENIPFKTLACSASLRLIKIKPLSIQRSQRITGKYQTISQPP